MDIRLLSPPNKLHLQTNGQESDACTESHGRISAEEEEP